MKPGVRDTALFVPSPEVVARDIAGQHILVPICTGLAQMDCLFTTDEVGSFVYRLLDGRSDARTLARRVAATFTVDEETALADVVEFLGTLSEAGLIRSIDPAP